jgi:hypothetical protein
MVPATALATAEERSGGIVAVPGSPSSGSTLTLTSTGRANVWIVVAGVRG